MLTVSYLAKWTGQNGLDAVLGFSMSYGLGKTLGGASTKSMSYLKKVIDDTPKFAVRLYPPTTRALLTSRTQQ